MELQRKIIWLSLAILGYMIILAWNEDYPQAVTTRSGTPQQAEIALDSAAAPALSDTAGITQGAADELEVPGSKTQQAASGKDPLPDSKAFIRIETDTLRLKVDLKGGNFAEASLLAYKKALNSEDALLLLNQDSGIKYLIESSLIGEDGFDASKNGGVSLYQAAQTSYQLTPGQDRLQVDLKRLVRQDTSPFSQVELIKRFTFQRDSYEVQVDYLINNQSSLPFKANFAGKIVRDEAPDPSAQNSLGMSSFLGMVLSRPEERYQKYDFSDLKEHPVKISAQGGWIAFLQHYFLTAWIPDQTQTQHYQTTLRGNSHVMGFVGPEIQVEPGQQQQVGAKVYMGPKIMDRLESVAPSLDRTVDYGFLFFIAHPLFLLMEWFHEHTGNWGIAIILLTISIKGLFYWLSKKSYESMARMRSVGPQMTRLRELYGDDRQRLSTEMMSLYKREKINPLGGCLPVLVQMPVFISLYWVIFESVQLRHAPFFGWIQDLSVMDPYFILPILMGASMFIQTSLNPAPPDPVQARVMKMMPIIFSVFFLWFPAGLVLYWVVNNLLSITQQWFINRQIEDKANKGGTAKT